MRSFGICEKTFTPVCLCCCMLDFTPPLNAIAYPTSLRSGVLPLLLNKDAEHKYAASAAADMAYPALLRSGVLDLLLKKVVEHKSATQEMMPARTERWIHKKNYSVRSGGQ